MLKNIKNIIFDIGGVLIDLDKDRCIAAFTRIGFPKAAELIDFYHPAEFFNRLERGEISATECCDTIREMAGNPTITDEQIREAYCAFLVSVPVEKLRLIKHLRDKGYRIYALSNINEIVISKVRELFTADGLTCEDYFERMFLSFEMRSLKPDAEIFEQVIRESGVVPSETLFLDDGLKNINAGREAGFEVYMPQHHEDFSHLFEESNL